MKTSGTLNWRSPSVDGNVLVHLCCQCYSNHFTRQTIIITSGGLKGQIMYRGTNVAAATVIWNRTTQNCQTLMRVYQKSWMSGC